MNMASSSPDMPAMYRGLFTQPSAIQLQLNPQVLLWHGHLGAHLFLYLIIGLKIYSLELDFQIIFNWMILALKNPSLDFF